MDRAHERKHSIYIGILLVISLATHFIFFGHPNQTVFDEVHFGKFISGYYTHHYFFDIHPPLGKLIIASFGKLFNFDPQFSFANIGEKFPDYKYLALRFLPSLAGALLALVLYLLALELGLSQLASFVIGVLISLESALLVQSRFILLDSFLLLFGFTALTCYFFYYNRAHEKGAWKSLLAAGVFGAFAVSVKWTGLTFLALPWLMEAWAIIRHRHFKNIIPALLALVLVPVIIYFSVFAIHFLLLTKSGPGDAFMSPEFQKTLAGTSYSKDTDLRGLSLPEKFLELNREMYLANQRLTASHPYGSAWYTWPLMLRPVYYWVDDNQRIYLLGNPAIWWLSTAAVLVFLCSLFIREFRKHQTTWVLLLGYGLNLLPFVGIGRVMFLYHYFSALVFAIIILVYSLDKGEKRAADIFGLLVFLALISFIYFAPLTYGLKLTPEQYQHRVWLKSWQ